MSERDISSAIYDVGAAWKVVSRASTKEISALISTEETRVSDVILSNPNGVAVAFGEEYVPRGKKLAEFRGKFGENNGKTIFEYQGGWDFTLESVWGDLVEEIGRADPKGPVTVALRETLGKMELNYACEFLKTLDGVVQQKKPSCQRLPEEQRSLGKEEPIAVGGAENDVGGVMGWVTRDLSWSPSLNPCYSFQAIPFMLRYFRNVDPTHLARLLQMKFQYINDIKAVLQSIIIVATPRPHDERDKPALFSRLCAILRENLETIPPEWMSLAGVFLGATREQVAAASSHHLVSDVNVGGATLKLLHQQTSTIAPKKKTWEIIASDVIQVTSCCDLPAVLEELRRQMEDKATLPSIPSAVAAPLFRALLKRDGVEWSKARLAMQMWQYKEHNTPYLGGGGAGGASVGSLSLLLHSAIELGELEEVRERAWPGLLPWRNGEGKTALQLATEKYDELHPIRLHLEKLTLSIKLS